MQADLVGARGDHDPPQAVHRVRDICEVAAVGTVCLPHRGHLDLPDDLLLTGSAAPRRRPAARVQERALQAEEAAD